MQHIDISTKRGQTWCGYVLTLTDSLSSPIDLTDAKITSDVKFNTCDNEKVLEFSNDNGLITVLDATNGVLQLLPIVIDVTPKVYQYDLKITLSNGTVLYPMGGKFTVQSNVTR